MPSNSLTFDFCKQSPFSSRLLVAFACILALLCADFGLAQSNSSTRKKQVVSASFYEEDDEEEQNVVQASCPNCQSNRSTPASRPVLAEESYGSASSFDEGVVSGSCGRSCDAGCDSNCGYNGVDVHFPGGGFITLNCDPCSPLNLLSRRLYMRAESAFFWGSGQFLPTLVTTSDANPILPIEEAGLLNDPDTRSLFGGGEVGDDSSNGLRFEAGFWFDDCKSRGVLFRMFDSGDNDVGITTNNSINPIIARNFLDVGPPRDQSLVSIAYPNQTTGNLSANLSSSAYGGDLLGAA